MEYYWSLFNNCSNTARGHNGNFNPSHAWDLATTYYSPPPPAAAAFQSVTGTRGGGGEHSTMHRNPDPHPTCLKLGKRRCFGDLTPPPPPFDAMKRVKNASAPAAAPRCQVEGCEAVLVNAKDYHRRHKVCEMHAKAPTVVLLGIDQRFCQQCSRFHAVGAFDEAKRSCRRRLAGHNERRRKSSQEHSSFARKQYQEMKMVGGGRHPQPHLLNNSGCALSLLSPASYGTWSASPAPDRPSRCSAALRELIAENRASVYACSQFDAIQIGNNCKVGPGWAEPENRGHVTLNLMQGPDSAFGLFSGHGHRPSEEDGGGDCSELWKLPMGY